MTTPQLARQVLGWIEIDPAAPAPVDPAAAGNDANLAAVFARWARQGAKIIALPAPVSAAAEPTPTLDLPANSPAPRRRSAHNASPSSQRRSARFPRRARADLTAISADLEAQFTDLRRRFAAVS